MVSNHTGWLQLHVIVEFQVRAARLPPMSQSPCASVLQARPCESQVLHLAQVQYPWCGSHPPASRPPPIHTGHLRTYNSCGLRLVGQSLTHMRPSLTFSSSSPCLRCPRTSSIRIDHGLIRRQSQVSPPPSTVLAPMSQNASSKSFCSPCSGPSSLEYMEQLRPGLQHCRDALLLLNYVTDHGSTAHVFSGHVFAVARRRVNFMTVTWSSCGGRGFVVPHNTWRNT